jgi:hypothetical protein
MRDRDSRFPSEQAFMRFLGQAWRRKQEADLQLGNTICDKGREALW